MRALVILQFIVAFFLIVSILFQSRGSGMSMSSSGGNYYARRGFEQFLFYVSIVLVFLFIAIAGINAYVSNNL